MEIGYGWAWFVLIGCASRNHITSEAPRSDSALVIKLSLCTNKMLFSHIFTTSHEIRHLLTTVKFNDHQYVQKMLLQQDVVN